MAQAPQNVDNPALLLQEAVAAPNDPPAAPENDPLEAAPAAPIPNLVSFLGFRFSFFLSWIFRLSMAVLKFIRSKKKVCVK